MFKYFGSKYLLSDAYPAPMFSTIVEPFAGSAAYAVRHRMVADKVILVERDERIVALWRRILGTSADALMALPDPQPGEWCTDLLVALAAGRTTRDTPDRFRVSPRMAQRFRPMLDRIVRTVDECRHFEVRCGDYTSAPDVEATWFIDPPYQYQGGRWDRSRGGRYLYPNRFIDYTALARWATSRQGQVIVCEQSGADWLPWNVRIKARNGTHNEYDEVCWLNGCT